MKQTIMFTTVSFSFLTLSTSALGQIDISRPIPNVLLLIDTSGSMENMANGKSPEDDGATCNPGVPTKLNRWASLVSVLTGTIQNFSCVAQARTSDAFKSEYAIDGTLPYDADYYLPFHRILSNKCTAGPGALGISWSEWNDNAIKWHAHDNVNANCAEPGFQQTEDGLLDSFNSRARFGLMTFDTFPDAGTGVIGEAISGATGIKGMWSYYSNWNNNGTPASGYPPKCEKTTFEVGARNPAAPPWEGRLIGFGPQDADVTATTKTNSHIQQALIAMRPYGATPLAGMLTDATYYLLNDTSIDPETQKYFGPSKDDYFVGGCRPTYIILLSDGEPNMDLRDDCSAQGGKCPYKEPYEIAYDLAHNPDTNQRVMTYAVGFGLSSDAGVDCNTLSEADLKDFTQPKSKCAGATGALKACCTLGRIAYEGGSSNAYFADDIGTLKTALATVLGKITSGSTSRTFPVFSSASASVQGNAKAASYQFVSSFNAPFAGTMWSGNLERKRYECKTDAYGSLYAELQPINKNLGDDFDDNINKNDAKYPRKFITVVGTKTDTKINSSYSIRPSVSTDDGLGIYSGTATNLLSGSDFATQVRYAPEAFNISTTSVPETCTSVLKASDANICAERLVRWNVGESNMPTLTETRDQASCPSDDSCSELGSIYHSNPVVLSPPREFLRDESYSQYATEQATRAPILFTATTDGQLHAFKIASNDPKDTYKVDQWENNELWSFMPPQVLPRLLSTYNQQQVLLDGPVIVKDVIFERKEAEAKNGTGSSWHSVLVGSGGAGGGFYYALDVTDPTKPSFLWQLSTNASGTALFGANTPAAAIATIALEDGDGIKEVAVAILPGGSLPLQNGSCDRQQTTWSNIQGSYAPRSQVRCWEKGKGGRSLTIVKLNTGEVLMNLRASDADGPAGLINNSKNVLFDSPITGIPIPYPGGVGQVSSRIYIGDADGTLWRVDLSSTKPSDWYAEIIWDAYSLSGDTASISEPIQTPPIVSVDPSGNLVLIFSTGDQETLTNTSAISRVWSITEEPVDDKFTSKANWKLELKGERVTGPISLFNSVAYFATYTPSDPDAACKYGSGALWAVDYREPKSGSTKLCPTPRAPDGKTISACSPYKSYDKSVIFGVSVTQTPTCSQTEQFVDPYLGTHTSVSNVTAGQFQLVFQTSMGGQASDNSSTNTVTETLQAPTGTTRIDSWATVLE